MGRAKRPKPKHLAKKLALIRQSLGVTHEELITRLDCPDIPLYRASISQYESGRIIPSLPVLLKYARLANIVLDVLVDDEIILPDKIPAAVKELV